MAEENSTKRAGEKGLTLKTDIIGYKHDTD
jgi:hypothetical protein